MPTIPSSSYQFREVSYVAIFLTPVGYQSKPIVGFDAETRSAIIRDNYGYLISADTDPYYVRNEPDTTGLAHGRSIIEQLADRDCEHSGNTADTCLTREERAAFPQVGDGPGYCPPCLGRPARIPVGPVPSAHVASDWK